jgi:predicted peptidase
MLMLSRKTAWIWFLLLIPIAGFGQSEAALQAYEARFFDGQKGWQLPYRILYPKQYDPTQKYPLVLFMHGSGERGNDNNLQLVHGADLFLREGVRDSFPAIVVFPQCAEKDYWVNISRVKTPAGLTMDYPFKELANPSMQLVEELLDHLLVSEQVDEDRVYVMGLSMGGMGTFELLARHPDRFAAAVPICGGGNRLLTRLYADQVPVWVFHGDADKVVDVQNSRNMVEAIAQNGGEARYTEYPGIGHLSWEKAFAEPALLPWLFAQKRKAPKTRYVDPLFPAVKRQTFTYAIKAEQELQLDWYAPVDDPLTARPTILYMHGGGFSGGTRDGLEIETFAKELAKRGYCVVSMSYRLTLKGQSFSCDQPTPNKIRTFQYAVEDIREATNFLVLNHKKLGIDPTNIVLAGSSAGGEGILHAVFWEDENLLPESPTLPEGFKYTGYINMAGAMVEDIEITPDNAIPALLFHGTCDPLVPFKTAPHHYCPETAPGFMVLQGSYSIAEKYHAQHLPYSLVIGCGVGHEWASEPMFTYLDQVVDFLKTQVIDGTFQQERIRVGLTDECDKGDGKMVCPGE